MVKIFDTLLWPTTRGQKSTVVVEIGNDWLKIISYYRSRQRGVVDKVHLSKLASIQGSVSEEVAQAFKGLKMKRENVILSIPRNLVTMKTLEFPSQDPKEINSMAELQIGKQTPYSRAEIISSHRTFDAAKTGYTKVLFVIAQRSVILERIDVLQKGGISVEKVVAGPEARFQWFQEVYKKDLEKQAVIFVDVDSNHLDFMIIAAETLVYTRNILIDAGQVTASPQRMQEKLIAEMEHTLRRYQSETEETHFTKIFLTGAIKNVRNLEQPLAQGLNMPVEIVYPLSQVQVRPQALTVLEDEGSYVSVTTILGAAVRPENLELDLIPRELQIQRQMEVKRKRFTVMGVLILGIIVACSLLLTIHIYKKNIYLSDLKREIASIQKDADEVERMRAGVHLVKNRLNARHSTIDILHALYFLTPPEIYFTSINVEEKKQAVLRGRTDEMSDVFQFVTTLENSPQFENVKTTYTTTKKDKEKQYVQFEIICMCAKGLAYAE